MRRRRRLDVEEGVFVGVLRVRVEEGVFVGVLVEEGVFVGDLEGVFDMLDVEVGEGVLLDDLVGDFDGDWVRDSEIDRVGVREGVLVFDANVSVAVKVDEGESDREGVAEGDNVGVGDGVGVDVGDGVD